MKKVLYPILVLMAANIVACQKAPEKVEPVPFVEEPEAYFVEGLASAHASNPTTRSWAYTNAGDVNDPNGGSDILAFRWSDNAYATDGTARFEGYWADQNGYFGETNREFHAILNDAQHATYVATVDGNTNIHVSLPAAASAASKLVVIYSGNNVNHTYWFDDPSHAEVSLSEDRKGISLSFSNLNKRNFYAPNLDNNEAIYGVATLTPGAITQEGDEAATSVDFNFKHLESVFRVRILNGFGQNIALDEIRIFAKPKATNAGTAPFADKLILAYANGAFTRSLYEDPDIPGSYQDRDWFETEPVNTIPDSDNDPKDPMTIAPGSIQTVYLMPLANPACNLNNWLLEFTVETTDGKNYSVSVDGSAIANATGKSALEPGYVYTVGVRAAGPEEIDCQVGDIMLHFEKTGHDLKLLPPSNGNYSGDIVIPSEITVNGETYHIRKIGQFAFATQPVTSVVFPDYMEFEDTELLFARCVYLTSVTLPKAGLNKIGNQMFGLCVSLESLTIPASVTQIGSASFAACPQLGGHISSLSSSILVNESGMVYSPSGELYWIPENLSGTVNIPDGITKIMSGATFMTPPGLGFPTSVVTELVIPASVTRIDELNFVYMQNLRKLTVNWTTPANTPSWYINGLQVINGQPAQQNVSVLDQWFAGMDRSTIELSVPAGCGDLYRNAEPWRTFGLNVVERQ